MYAYERTLPLYRLYCMYVCPLYLIELCSGKTIWRNGSFRNRENLQYKKTADSVLFSLFMRTNVKCNDSHAPPPHPPHRLKRYSAFCQIQIFLKDQNMKNYHTFCFPSEPNIPERSEYEKISTPYLCMRRSFTNSTRHNYSCCDLKVIWEKMDPSVIEKTYTIR